VAAARKVGQHAGVLVIRVRGDHQDAAELVETLDRFEQVGSSGERLLLSGQRRQRREK